MVCEWQNEFDQFFIRNGITFNRNFVSICHSEVHGYGISATAALKPGCLLAVIPKTTVLSLPNSVLWEYLHLPETQEISIPHIFQLPAAVLFESLLGEESKWHAYLNSLPSSLKDIGIPLAFEDHIVNSLCGGTGLDLLTRNLRRRLEKAYATLHSIFSYCVRKLGREPSIIDGLSHERFILAYAWVTSRAFKVDDIHGNAMVPIADIFNHQALGEHVHIEGMGGDDDDSDDDIVTQEGEGEFDTNSVDEGADVGGKESNGEKALSDRMVEGYEELKIRAVRKAEKGEEVFNTFGQKCNTVLLLNYGFAENSNKFDTAFVHRSDIDQIMKRHCESIKDFDQFGLSKQRVEALEAAEGIIFDEVVDDFFQITTDGSFCHGLLIITYLYVVSWNELKEHVDDEMMFLEYLMNLSGTEIANTCNGKVADLVAELVGNRIEELELGGVEMRKFEQRSDCQHVKDFAQKCGYVREGQVRVLRDALEQLMQVVVRKGKKSRSGEVDEREVKRAKTE